MLTIHEIYTSIQGESTHAGRPCTFVRLTACDLRCAWCDTPYAFTGGRKMSLDEVVAEVDRLGCPVVEITGGEPLLQKDDDRADGAPGGGRRTVLLETGGHISVASVPREVVKIIDVKCPGSGESARHHWPNMDALAPHDEVKFVIADRADYEYARDVTRRFGLGGALRRRALLARAQPCSIRRQLSAWIIEDAFGAAAAPTAQVHLGRRGQRSLNESRVTSYK